VAWERPDAFRKVLSHIGSFADIRGGHVIPSRIRKEPLRPLRVYLQDGENDLNNAAGDWWLANLQMVSALKYRGYDVRFDAGSGGHDGKHGGAVLPDALRWLWRGS
jgi:enterochelin esterase family protein